MRKILTSALVLILVLSIFTGCQKTVTTEGGSTPAESKNTLEGKTIIVGRWGGNDAETTAFNKAVSDFTAKTGIKVEERIYSDYNTELQTALIGDEAPDVFYVDAYMAPFYIEQGVLTPLDASEFQLDKFYDSLKNAFVKDGKYYSVSKDYSTLALYYNKKWVNENEIPKTLEELFNGDFLVNLKAKLPKDVAAMTYNQDLAREMYLAQAGGFSITKEDGSSNLSDSNIVNNLSVEIDAAKAGKIVTPQDLGLGWNGDAFGNEKTAIMIEGNWVLGHLQQNFPDVDFGVIEIPTFKGQKGTMVFTVGYSIYAKSSEVDAAKEFIKYITGPEGMATWTTGAGVLPSRTDVAEATKVKEDPLKIPHIAGAEYSTAWQKGVFMDTINNSYKNYLPSAIKGERTLAEAMKLAEEEANKTIEANK